LTISKVIINTDDEDEDSIVNSIAARYIQMHKLSITHDMIEILGQQQ